MNSELTSSPGPIGSVHDLARLMNLTPRRVEQLAKEGIIAKIGIGKYDLTQCLSMYIAHLAEWRAPAEIPCSIHDISHYSGLTENQILHLIGKGVIPAPIKNGRFDLVTVIRSFVAFVHKRGFVSFYGQGSLVFSPTSDTVTVETEEASRR